MILGIDEVGRGPWAGPLVIGAVVLGGTQIDGLTDSKKLSKKRREELDKEIREQAAGFGLGWVSATEIDEIGLSAALRLATIRAVEQVKTSYSEIIIDGTINFLADTGKASYVTTLKKADLLIPSVSAASIIAKVARDNYMASQDEMFPGYGFSGHVGYGTAKHRAAIEQLGVTPLHRLSFAPLAKYKSAMPSRQTPDSTFAQNGFAPGPTRAPASGRSRAADVLIQKGGPTATSRTTKQIGDQAEMEVANYLVRAGHDILERNWRMKWCEIDIVSRKDDTIYFTEVKYRKNDNQGGGVAAITPKKLRQMKFAAELYVLQKKANDNLQLCYADVLGDSFELKEWGEV